MNTINKKEILTAVIAEFFPMFSLHATGMIDRLTDRLVAALVMQEHPLFQTIKALTDAGALITVDEVGDEEYSNDPKQVFEYTQEVDEAYLYLYSPEKVCAGWVLITNCNDPDESVCDYTCGLNSVYSEILDKQV